MAVMGTRMLRKEDPKLLTGEAKYVDDIHAPGELWMGMVRSTVANARIASIDVSGALEQPGVVGAYTGADLSEGYWLAPLPCAWPVTADMLNPPHFPVAIENARYVGDIVAVVLANSRYAAADAVEHVVVEYDELPAVATVEAAVAGEALAHPDLGTNKAYTWALDPDPDATQAALDASAHRVSARFVQQRLIPSAMEPRGVLAVPSPYGGDITLYSATQVPHILKVMVAATTGIPEHNVRIVAPSVGGGFGAKLNINADEILAVALANRLKRPVRWTESRSEAALSTTQGRGQVQHIEIGSDADGKLTALDGKMNFDSNALYRHPDIAALRDETEEDKAELEASKYDLNYITLDGTIGCMVNGAGLAMATMDIIKLYGESPANFLDVGGGASKEKVTAAFKIITADPNVKGILINIFGGIMKCDIIAEGVIAAVKEVGLKVPLVVRLEGTNVDQGKKIISESKLNVIPADDLDDAAQKIVKAVKEAA